MPPILISIALLIGSVQAKRQMGPEASLQRGQYLRAIQLFKAQTQADPGNEQAQLGLGRAQIALGRCERGLTLLTERRDSPHWSHLTSASEATCAMRDGDYALAAAAYTESIELNPEHGRAWFGLFRAQFAESKFDAAAESIDRAAQDSRVEGLIDTAKALLDWQQERSDIDTDLYILASNSEEGSNLHRRMLSVTSAERWLDLGDPKAALPQLKSANARARGNVRAAALLAEAHRRLGNLSQAAWAISHTPHRLSRQPLLASARVRLAHDQGEHVVSSDDWITLTTTGHPEALATIWYVLRDQDPQGAARAQVLWEQHVMRPDQALEDLLPWTVQ